MITVASHTKTTILRAARTTSATCCHAQGGPALITAVQARVNRIAGLAVSQGKTYPTLGTGLGGGVRIDRSDEADEPGRAAAPGQPPARPPDGDGDGDGDRDRGVGVDATTGRGVGGDGAERHQFPCPEQSVRLERAMAHRATVDADYRRHAIDQGCARVEKLEREIVTPAMHRIEAEDPDRTLIGLEHRLKGRDRIEESSYSA